MQKQGLSLVSDLAIVLTFRAARFGETELMKAIQAYIRHRQNAPPQHGKMKLKELMQRDQGATMMEMRTA